MKSLANTKSGGARDEGSIPFTRCPSASTTSVSSLSARLSHLDLFSGVGGFSIAAQWAGFKTVAFCEKEPYVQKVLIEKFGAVLADTDGDKPAQSQGSKRQQRRRVGNGGPNLHPDIFTLNGADYRGVTLITGGFPCQPFSLAGKRRGAADDRHLWPEMLRVIEEARPAWVLAENVPGLIGMELGNYLFDVASLDSAIAFGLASGLDPRPEIIGERILGLHSVKEDLQAIGYAVQPVVIPACSVDARHRRDRVWILAHSGRGRGWQSPGTADSAQETLRSTEWCESALQAGPSGSSLANTQGSRAKPEEQFRQCGEPQLHGETQTSLANTGSTGLEERSEQPTREERPSVERSCETLSDARCRCREGAGSDQRRTEESARRLPQSEFRRVFDGLPEGLDGSFCVWPAEEESTPRVAKGIPHRSHRLKALGNSIVPQVAFQILRLIAQQENHP